MEEQLKDAESKGIIRCADLEALYGSSLSNSFGLHDYEASFQK